MIDPNMMAEVTESPKRGSRNAKLDTGLDMTKYSQR